MEPGLFHEVVPGVDIDLDNDWKLSMTLGPALPLAVGDDNLTAQFDISALGDLSSLAFRTRKPRDYISPFGLGGSKSLQDLFVDAKIPVDYRHRIPVLAFRHGSEVLWVPGRGGRRSSHALINNTTERVVMLRFERTSQIEGED
jgi:tRNA(Ile)-lysidine synthase